MNSSKINTNGKEDKNDFITPNEQTYAPVLIIGTGIGGLTAAYYLSKNNIDYIITTQGKVPKNSNTYISNANTRVPEEAKKKEFIELTIEKCGANRSIIETIYNNSDLVKTFYQEINIPVKKTVFGVMPLSSKKSHGGKIIVDSLLKKIRNPLCNYYLISLERKDHYIHALFYDTQTDKFKSIISNYLIIATGGYGSLFSNNDNANSATGEALILAKNIGANLKGMSTVMFHPWSIYKGKQILVGEIVSLCGGKVVTDNNIEIFQDEKIQRQIANNDYHESFKEILEAEFKVLKEKRNLYLDLSNISESSLKEKLREHGFSPNTVIDNKIKVGPTIHYTSGGIEVNTLGRSIEVENLYVIGEAQFDGNIGVGRMPGQPLASAIVFSYIVANQISKERNFIFPNRNIYFTTPTFIKGVYSPHLNSNVLDEELKQLGNILMDIVSSNQSSINLLELKEKIIHRQENILRNLRGKGNIFKNIIKLYRGYDIANEIILDKLRKERNEDTLVLPAYTAK